MDLIPEAEQQANNRRKQVPLLSTKLLLIKKPDGDFLMLHPSSD
jgi:hypothetical protein